MFGDSIAVPAARVTPVATEAASNAKSIAGVIFFLAVVTAMIGLGIMSDPKAKAEDGVIPMFVMGGIIASIGMRYVRGARRASAALARAKADPSSQWFLTGKLIVGTDSAGVPSPELTFKISGKLRAMLLAVPTATVVERGKRAP